MEKGGDLELFIVIKFRCVKLDVSILTLTLLFYPLYFHYYKLMFFIFTLNSVSIIINLFECNESQRDQT